jgi:hypothetical protein
MMNCVKKIQGDSFRSTISKINAIQDLTILQSGESVIAVSPAFQGRVFTSSSQGVKGKGYGWINMDLIEDGSYSHTMANLGGESRLWFAPENGPHGFFYPPGMDQNGETLRAPTDLNTVKFIITKKSDKRVSCNGEMVLLNALNQKLKIKVDRTISILDEEEIEQELDIDIDNSMSFVGFSAETTVTNAGENTFNESTGLFSIWELGCMLTSTDNIVIIPLSKDIAEITPYFTPIGDRAKIINKTLFYKADAQGMNKIGVPAEMTTPILGSYSPSNRLLNIVTFHFENGMRYANSIPGHKDPYKGDVINVFNGEVNQELNRNWPFYEFETISQAKKLDPGEQIYHRQTTFHFEGNKSELDNISRDVLGVSLDDIPVF